MKCMNIYKKCFFLKWKMKTKLDTALEKLRIKFKWLKQEWTAKTNRVNNKDMHQANTLVSPNHRQYDPNQVNPNLFSPINRQHDPPPNEGSPNLYL